MVQSEAVEVHTDDTKVEALKLMEISVLRSSIRCPTTRLVFLCIKSQSVKVGERSAEAYLQIHPKKTKT